MSVSYLKTSERKSIAVWEITETEGQLLDHCFLSEKEKSNLNSTNHPIKRLELLAGKCTVQFLVKQSGYAYHGIQKDEFGKPFLINSDQHISITHSFPYAAAILNPDHTVGIDMEKPKEKIRRIAHKFLDKNELEYAGVDLERLCSLWSAKEAVYKEYGRKSLIFKENIKILGSESNFKAILNTEDEKRELFLKLERVHDHILCYTC